MAPLKNYTMAEFQQGVVDAMFPRELIIKKNPSAWNDIVISAIEQLDEMVFKFRIYEFDVTSNQVDLSVTKIPLGVEVGKILTVLPATDSQLIFNIYREMLGRPEYSFNILRHQDDFIDYLFSTEVSKQLTKRFQNYDTGYFRYGDKLILDGSFGNISKITVLFLPNFILDGSETAWELYNIEAKFVNDHIEGETMYREGRAMSEMNIMDMNTNSDMYMSDGKEMMDAAIEGFRRKGFTRIGKKF